MDHSACYDCSKGEYLNGHNGCCQTVNQNNTICQINLTTSTM